MANVLRQAKTADPSDELPITAADYVQMLGIYARSHRKDGRPYLAEALHPDTGSFEGHDGYNHSEHYFHSGYCDLVISGLVGLVAQPDDTVVIDPLAPPHWDYFALDDVVYHDRRLSILWDKTGHRYGQGRGLHVLCDGKLVGSSPQLKRMHLELPPPQSKPTPENDPVSPTVRMNYAVNNDGDYLPRISASFTAPGTSLAKLVDGNYWYHLHPPNRWSTAGSPNESDWVAIDFGKPREIDSVKLYFLDDPQQIKTPAGYVLQVWNDGQWRDVPLQQRRPQQATGHRANTITFPEMKVQKLRVVLDHAENARSGLTELEAWGDGKLPYTPASPPAGNLAYNAQGNGFPKATASFSDRYGGQPMKAIDGRIIFSPTPMNRWTSYGSPDKTDWLAIDFGQPQWVNRVELSIYDDRGGVQPPKSYGVQHWDGQSWAEVTDAEATPAVPAGGVTNTVRFQMVKTSKLRVVFTHQGQSRSGVTEMEVWNDAGDPAEK